MSCKGLDAFVLDKCFTKEKHKVNIKFTLSTGYESPGGEEKYSYTLRLTSALDGGE